MLFELSVVYSFTDSVNIYYTNSGLSTGEIKVYKTWSVP